MTYPETIRSLLDNLSIEFDEVYHSVEIIVTDSKERFPAVSNVNEWINLSPTDQREIVYIRRAGDDDVFEEQRIASCGKAYKMRSPLRIVFFKDNAQKHEEILFKLMQSVLVGGTRIKSIVRDKFKLLKDESSGDYNFKPTTAYFAIDIYAFWILQEDLCEQDFCIDIENPVKKCEPVIENS